MGASAPVQYGADPLQFVIPLAAPSPGAPTVIMYGAAGWGSAANLAQSIVTNADGLQAAGYCVFIVSYRGSIPPIGGTTYPANLQGALAAWPMAIDDAVAGSIAALELAPSYNGTDSSLHYAAGSAGASLAALAAAELLDLDLVVDSVQTLSMNTDWWTSIQQYWIDLNDPTSANHPVDNQHLTNVANALGVFHESSGNSASAPAHPSQGTLEWHLNGAPNTYGQYAGWGQGYPTGSDIWTAATFAPFAPAQRCSLRASRCWWQLFNSSDEEIPLAQPYTFMEAMSNVGSMATLTVLPGNVHAYNYWTTVLPSIIQFIHQTSSH